MRRLDALEFSVFGAILFCALASPFVSKAQAAPFPAVQGQTTTLDVAVTSNVAFDTNVARASAAVALFRGLKTSDEIFIPSVRMNLGHRLGRQTVYLQGDVGYDFYRRNSILNRENISLTPGFLTVIGPCQADVNANYGRHQSELANLAFDKSLGGPVHNTDIQEKIGATGSCGKPIGFAPTFSISEFRDRNSRLPFTANDFNSFTGNAGIAYRQPTLGTIDFFGSYTQSNYIRRGVLINGVTHPDGFEVYAGGVSYERKIGVRLTGTVSVSYTSLRPFLSPGGGFRGLTYNADLSYALDERVNANFLFSRATTPSGRLGATYSTDDTLGSEIDYTMTSRLMFKAGGSWVHRSYPEPAIPQPADITKETVYSGFWDADYKLNRRTSLVLDVNYTRRDANFPGLSYSGERVGLTVKLSF